jgi:DNA-binding transcriptional regulator YhcF (GntR family)
MAGWIKLHRQIESHWIYQNSNYLHWWIDILISANFEPKKVLIKGHLLECRRGECLYSLETWAKRWNTNKPAVNRFLTLLKKDGMITLKSETVTTRLTICKYDSYQDEQNGSETQKKRTRNGGDTKALRTHYPTKEGEEDKEGEEGKEYKFDFSQALLSYGFDKTLVSEWLEVRRKKKAVNTETAYKGFITEVEKTNLDKNKVLQMCVEKSWQGFTASWIKEDKPNNKPANLTDEGRYS